MNTRYYVAAAMILFILISGIIKIIDSSGELVYMPLSIEVKPATIIDLSSDGGEYYCKLLVPAVTLDRDAQWIQVQSPFYYSHKRNDRIGILLGNYDVFKKTREHIIYGDPIKKYIKTEWHIENVYDTIQDAEKFNPVVQFTMDAQLLRKKAASDGTLFFILDAQGQKIKTIVEKSDYDRYNEGAKIECQFESIGDFTKFTGIKG